MEMLQEIIARSSEKVYEFIDSLPDEELHSEAGSDKKWIRCRSCHFKIALLSDKTNINNTDTHMFKNSAGIFYRVVCFANAPGTIDITEYTTENTWFEGYSWSITLCRSCNSHIGWHYSSGSEEFYGLIADRLAGI